MRREGERREGKTTEGKGIEKKVLLFFSFPSLI